MVNPNHNISRYPYEDSKETARTKPLASPGNDRFRKSMDGRNPKRQEKEEIMTKQEGKSPSLFDLSGSKKKSLLDPSSIKSPDSPVLPEPNTQFSSSEEPLFNDQISSPKTPTSSVEGSNTVDALPPKKPTSQTSKVQVPSNIDEQPIENNFNPPPHKQQETSNKPGYKPHTNTNIADQSNTPGRPTTRDISPEAIENTFEGNKIDRDYKSHTPTTSTESKVPVTETSLDNSSENHSSSGKERQYSEKNINDNKSQSQRTTSQELQQQKTVEHQEERKSQDISRAHSNTTEQLEADTQTQTNEHQQVRVKKQQIKRQKNSQIEQTQINSNVQAPKLKGESAEAPLFERTSEHIPLGDKHASSFRTPFEQGRGNENLALPDSLQLQEELSLGTSSLSPNETLGTKITPLDPEKQIKETMMGETIEKNLKSEIVVKKQLTENSEKLMEAVVDERVGPLSDPNKDNKIKSHSSEKRHIDIEAVSNIQTPSLQTEVSAETQQPLPPQTTQDLATQIISQIQVLTTKDEMRTTITLKHPPLLKDATITLTASNNAKSEFNISIANLSSDAKTRLDIHLKENSLIDHLSEKGIVVHMLTTSTQAEPTLVFDDKTYRERQEQQPRDQQQHERNRESEDQQQKQQGKRQRFQEFEEENE